MLLLYFTAVLLITLVTLLFAQFQRYGRVTGGDVLFYLFISVFFCWLITPYIVIRLLADGVAKLFNFIMGKLQ